MDAAIILMDKMKNKIVVVLISLIFFIALSSKAWAQEPRIVDILITNDVENVLLYARLVNGFKPEMELAVLAGIPTIFTMSLEVYEQTAP